MRVVSKKNQKLGGQTSTRTNQKQEDDQLVVLRRKKFNLNENRPIGSIIHSENTIECAYLLETVNELNRTTIRTGRRKGKFEHWSYRSERHNLQKNFMHLSFGLHLSKMRLPCSVTMTRFALRELDADDNLRVAMKWVKDALASIITGDYVAGKADSNKKINWFYDQVKSKGYGLHIRIEFT